MPGVKQKLGEAVLTLRVKGDEFRKGIAGAKKQTGDLATDTEKKTGRMRTAFGKVTGSIRGMAGEIPIVGGLLQKMVSPMGAVLGVTGLLTGAMVKWTQSTIAQGRALGEVQQTLQISVEPYQILSRVISETNGNAEKLDDAMIRLRRMIGEAAEGNKTAIANFDRLGLSWQELVNLQIDQALVKVVGATNDSLSPTEAAAVKADLLGRSYADLGGFANLTTEEMRQLVAQFREAVVVSDKTVKGIDDMDAALRFLDNQWEGTGQGIASFFIDQLAYGIQLLGDFVAIGRKAGDTIGWIGEKLGIAKEETEDTADAADHLLEALDGTTSAAEGATDAADDLAEAEAEVTDELKQFVPAADAATKATGKLTKAEKEAAENARLVAQARRESSRQIIEDSQTRVESLLASYAAEIKAEGDRIRAAEAAAAALAQSNADFLAQKHADDMAAWNLTEVEYKLAQAKVKQTTGEHYAALLQEAEEAGVKDLALLVAHNDKMAAENRAVALAEAQAKAEEAKAAEEADVQHRAALLATLTTHIGNLEKKISEADGREKTALQKQLDALKEKRDLAHAATLQDTLNAKQAEIDQVKAKIETAQGAELTALKAHHDLLVAEMGALATSVNAELDAIKRDIQVNVRVNGIGADGGRTGPALGAPGSVAGVGDQTGKPISLEEYNRRKEEWLTNNPKPTDVSFADYIKQRYGTEFADLQDYYDKTDRYRERRDRNKNQANNRTAFTDWRTRHMQFMDRLNRHPILKAQEGGFVRGVGDPFGRLVRVGENRTDEMIMPLPPGMLDALRSGGSASSRSGSRGKREGVIMLDGEPLGRFVVGSLYDAAHRGHLDVDELRVA